MKSSILGVCVCRGVSVLVEETPVDTLRLQGDEDFTVSFGFNHERAPLGLEDVLNLKRLLGVAEKRLKLRQEQAMRARNLTLEI